MPLNNFDIRIASTQTATNSVAALLFVFLCPSLFAIDDELRQVRTFAERGQFGTVESLCQEAFAQPDITEIDKIRWATELVHARSLQLLTVEPGQRDRMVSGLETLETTWLAGSAENVAPDLALARIMLRLQLAMAYQLLGDYQRLEADIASATTQTAAYRQARTTLHDALERLKTCQREFRALQQRPLALEYSITMQQGIIQKSLAQTFIEEAERNFALRQAAESFSELTAINSTEPVIVQCKLEKATCHRLAGELEQCKAILDPLRNANFTTPECRLRVEAEWIRYHIAARNNITELRREYGTERPVERRYPDFDIARLELFLMNDPAGNIRPEHAAARNLQDTIGRELGTYWGHRANRTVSMMTLRNPDNASAAMLATTADNLYREQQFAESAEMYEQAAARADVNRQADDMYRYNRSAVAAWSTAIANRAPDDNESAMKYEDRLIPLMLQLARQNPNHPEAVGLHVGAIDLLLRRIPDQSDVLDKCLPLIKEHAELWKDAPALPVLYRLAIIHLEQQRRTDEAVVLLTLIDLEQLGDLPAGIQRLRARQLDAEGKTQEAVAILIALLEKKRESATAQFLAEILSRQTDAKSLDDALNYWMELARDTARNSEVWWAAREGIIDVLFKLNRHEEAKKSFDSLRILYPELGGTERKERLMKRFE